MLHPRLRAAVMLGTVFLCLPCIVHAAEYTIDRDGTLFAIITHKAGAVAFLGHNHLIYLEDYTVSLSIEEGDPTAALFRLEFPAENLVVSDNEARERWYMHLEAAGILEKLPRKTSPTNRKKIREHMLSKKQLDVASHPTITVELKEVREEASEHGEKSYTHVASIDLTVHGETVTQDFPAAITFEDDTVHIEAFAALNFTDFGIKPYSALLGAIKNQDQFHLYVNLSASKSNG